MTKEQAKNYLHSSGFSEEQINEVVKALEPTSKIDLPHCQYTDEEIAKSFIEDIETVKDQLPCGEQMDFPSTFDEFAKDYGFKDKDEIYTNGSELISVFRVKQWLEHISTPKNNLGVDCISRADAIHAVSEALQHTFVAHLDIAYEVIGKLPSVTPKPRKGHWIRVTDKAGHLVWECDKCGWQQRFNTNYCPDCGADMREVEE